MCSDTGFLILSEWLLDNTFKLFVLAGTVACGSLFFAPKQSWGAFQTVLSLLWVRTVAVAIWSHIQAKFIHRKPEDDGSGVYGSAEINWHKQREHNAILAAVLLMPMVILWANY